MADLEFKHSVQQIPQGEALPGEIKRTERAEVIQAPDMQGAVSKYAEASNWMSSLGSYVATKSSNAIAAKLGGELGKNPQGDLGPALTEFDAEMQKSYQTQAHSTLGLQAQKLITQSNMDL